jgi:hypothetical protein
MDFIAICNEVGIWGASASSQFTFPLSIAFGLVASQKAKKLSKNIYF